MYDAEYIFNYVLNKYDLLLGVDEVIHIVTHNIDIDRYVEVNYDISQHLNVCFCHNCNCSSC